MRFFKTLFPALLIIILIASPSSSTNQTPDSAGVKGPKVIYRPLESGMLEPVEDELPPLPVIKLKNKTYRNKIVAVQVLLFDCETMAAVEQRIIKLKKSGVNTLIFRVFHNKGDRFYPFAAAKNSRGVYFKSRNAPIVDDILGDVANIAHQNDMDIYAWMTTRYANYGVEGKREWQGRGYDLNSRQYSKIKGLNLFNRDAKNHIISIYKDLAAYDIDGILFQDDLVLKHTEGFSNDARMAYSKEHSRAPDPDKFYRSTFRNNAGREIVMSYGEDFWDWSRWKNRALLGVAKEIMDNVRVINPDMKFAINLMYEAAIKPKEALAWLSQDLDEAVKTGFDLYAIMAYHRQIGEELGIKDSSLDAVMGELTANTIKKVGDPDKALIKLQIADWRDNRKLPYEEMRRFMKILRDNGATSYAFVPYYDDFDFRKLARNM